MLLWLGCFCGDVRAAIEYGVDRAWMLLSLLAAPGDGGGALSWDRGRVLGYSVVTT